jgi:hypothetical protein
MRRCSEAGATMTEHHDWLQPESDYQPSYMADEDHVRADLEAQREIPPVVVTDAEPEEEAPSVFDGLQFARLRGMITEDHYWRLRVLEGNDDE